MKILVISTSENIGSPAWIENWGIILHLPYYLTTLLIQNTENQKLRKKTAE